jgi:hypothetical protein
MESLSGKSDREWNCHRRIHGICTLTIFQAYVFFTGFSLISQTGEAYSIMVQLPAISIAVPALLAGGVVGAIVGRIRSIGWILLRNKRIIQ